MSTAVADAIADEVMGERLWFYANYHCNLECSYCLTESGPAVARRLLDPEWMVERAIEATVRSAKDPAAQCRRIPS